MRAVRDTDVSKAKTELIQKIRELKAQGFNPRDGMIRDLLLRLRFLDDPFRDMEHQGDDRIGRPARNVVWSQSEYITQRDWQNPKY